MSKEMTRVSKPHSIPCKFFAQGYCRLGNRCWYSHDCPGGFQSPFEYRRFEPASYQTHLGHQPHVRNAFAVRADQTNQRSLARTPHSIRAPVPGSNQVQSTTTPTFSFRAVEKELHLDTIKSAADLGFQDDEVYSASTDLSTNELRAYQSEEETFTLKSIPLSPPPLSFCVQSK
ncbi:hypothetical protein FGIG_02271 [Fasciola gigantica]|uniref:Nucleoporin NUP42 n=1 Tax=Fasciola gigantica TaxID=46835 RepID=A0A504YAW0_FASGI|nr:hypothetical protein FGIG_02271 [Fasciola gigantica]